MTETPNIPSVQSRQTEFSDDMIPAIQASIVQKRIWQSIWSLLIWGVVSFFLRVDFLLLLQSEGIRNLRENWPVLAWVVFNGGLIIAFTMILLGFYGMITRHPRIILIDGCMVGLIGLWNVSMFVLVFAIGDMLYVNLCFGLFQIYWGFREFRRHKIVVDWAKETAHITKEEKEQVKSILKKYRQEKENFFAGQLEAKVIFIRGWLRLQVKRYYFGKICPESAILVSSEMDGYLRISREKACVARYKKNGRVDFETKQGTHKVQFDVLSTLAWKKWANVRITPDDIKRLLWQGKISLGILRVFMRDGDPKIMKTVLKLLPLCHNAIGLTETVGEMLDDIDPTICTAALDVCHKIKAGLLHDKVIPLLKHTAGEVRFAAAKYFVSFPQIETVAALESVMPDEQDTRVYKQMEKAMQACQKAGQSGNSNPYAWR